jgi:Cu-Zn family superoxide dismutase
MGTARVAAGSERVRENARRIVAPEVVMKRIVLAVFVGGMVAALPVVAEAAPAARATLRDAQGKEIGTAALTPGEGGVKIAVKVSGVSPGQHGFHVHAAGKCEGPDFKSAGGHFNPATREHGLENPKGAHAGDMPNLSVGPDGNGKGEFLARGASLGEGSGSLFPEGGTSLVLHAAPDDMKTDPAGNAGARIACGVIERAN